MNPTRRDWLKMSAAAALAGALGSRATAEDRPSEPLRTPADAFTLGLAGYTVREFSVTETLDWMKRWNLRNWAVKDVHLPIGSSADAANTLRQQCETAGVRVYAAGVIYMKTADDVTRAFAYARRLGIGLMTAAPTIDLLPAVERAVQATGIKVAIHNHGPGQELSPTAESILPHIKDLDPRIGVCLDIGHTQRSGIDPSESFQHAGSRVLDMHIKDVSKAAKDGVTVPMGRGVIDFDRFLKTLRAARYSGVCSFEYESTKPETIEGLSESLGFWRALASRV